MTGFCSKAAPCDALVGLGLGLTGLRTTGLGRTIVTPTLALTGSGASCHAPQVLIAPSSSRWSNSDPSTPQPKRERAVGRGNCWSG